MGAAGEPRRRRRLPWIAILGSVFLSPAPDARAAGPLAIRSDAGLEARVSPDGGWEVVGGAKRWSFRGDVRARLGGLAAAAGSDALGAYREAAFSYDAGTGRRRAAIRLYEGFPAAIFVSTFESGGANAAPFPTFRALPRVAYHLSYDGAFIPYSFTKLGADSPWVFFDGDRNTFVLSAASHFVLARSRLARSGEVECGIDPAIREVPGGYEQRTILWFGTGIGATLEAWGSGLTTLSGKPRVPPDDGPELALLGYWTDNGAGYYYKSLPGKTAGETLLAVAARFRSEGIPLGYFQLDSWWYPKGKDGGFLDYRAAGPPIFDADLGSFRKELGLPLVVHGRWLSGESPIRGQWKTSDRVVVDFGWWTRLADALSAAGVSTFEQDWLGVRALPERNLSDPEAFLGNMAKALAGRSIRIQYCMAFPGDVLQSTLYPNVTTCRVSGDRFEPSKWSAFLHASLLARAAGLRPWTDVFRSAEPENLLLALLSSGVVGIGDAIGEENAGMARLAARTDGVLVKPDLPIVPTDATLVREAKGERGALVASTVSDFGGWKAVYVFATSGEGGSGAAISPRELGISGPAFLFDVRHGSGRALQGTETFRIDVSGSAYWLLVPAGRSGVSFLGDEGKLVPLGKKRIASVADDGTLRVRVLFAPGEETVRLHGFAARRPDFVVESGKAGPLEYEEKTGEFRLPISAEREGAIVSLKAN
jgi:hypothetical protein